MPWFVFRVGPPPELRVFFHHKGFAKLQEAEDRAHNMDIFDNKYDGPVDESVEPIIVEATDESEAFDIFVQEWFAHYQSPSDRSC